MATVSGVTASTIDSLLPKKFGVAAFEIPFVFPAVFAVNFRVVTFL
jgi:hypothetical protein